MPGQLSAEINKQAFNRGPDGATPDDDDPHDDPFIFYSYCKNMITTVTVAFQGRAWQNLVMETETGKKAGIRERKRSETLERIARTALRMFVDKGYDATTLEEIAAEAGISARTFFYYFKTKEEILEHFQGSGFFEMLRPTILKVSTDQDPLDAVRDCLLSLVSRYETEQSLAVDRLLRSTDALRRKKQLIFADMEAIIFESLCEIWPGPRRRKSLQLVAMVSVGAMRLGMDAWREDDGAKPLSNYVARSFRQLRAEI
jgi:AcrR family transcriptional regulator